MISVYPGGRANVTEFAKFSSGAVLSRGVGIWAKNLIPFLIITLIAHIPVFIIVFGQSLLTIGPAYLINKSLLSSATSMSELRTNMMLTQLIGAVLASLPAVFAAVCYHDLKRAKEGVGIDQLVSVFS